MELFCKIFASDISRVSRKMLCKEKIKASGCFSPFCYKCTSLKALLLAFVMVLSTTVNRKVSFGAQNRPGNGILNSTVEPP